MENFNENEKYLRAKKKVESIKGFYWHLFVSIFVIPFLAIVNYITTDFPWVIFPAAGILISIVIHWFVVFKSGSIFGKSWEDRKLREFMEEENDYKKLYK